MVESGFGTNETVVPSRRSRRHLRWVDKRTPPARTLEIGPPKRLLILGDVHLDAHSPRAWGNLRTFLERLEPSHTAGLVCLGDLFEYYLGAKHLRGPLGEAAELLAQVVQRGIAVYLVPGNRDFLIGEEFRQRGIEVFSHGLRLHLGLGGAHPSPGATARSAPPAALWIVHGDELMPESGLHRSWSRLSRTRFARLATQAMPVALLDWAARRMREQSRRRHRRRARTPEARLPRVSPTVAASLLAAWAEESGAAHWLVTGHFHVPLLERNDRGGLLTVGEWDGLGGVVGCFSGEDGAGGVTGRLLHSSEAVSLAMVHQG